MGIPVKDWQMGWLNVLIQRADYRREKSIWAGVIRVYTLHCPNSRGLPVFNWVSKVQGSLSLPFQVSKFAMWSCNFLRTLGQTLFHWHLDGKLEKVLVLHGAFLWRPSGPLLQTMIVSTWIKTRKSEARILITPWVAINLIEWIWFSRSKQKEASFFFTLNL